jgi:small subunit ribosomal protein S13
MIFIIKKNIIKKNFLIDIFNTEKKSTNIFFFLGKRYLPKESQKLTILYILTQIYGLGYKYRISLISSLFYMAKTLSIFLISRLNLQRIQFLLRNLFLNFELQKYISRQIAIQKKLQTYQGLRHLFHFPVRGQRTKTNAKVSRLKTKSKSLLTFSENLISNKRSKHESFLKKKQKIRERYNKRSKMKQFGGRSKLKNKIKSNKFKKK